MSKCNAEAITRALVEAMAGERRRQGLTYEQLAGRAGVHRTTIALWERQERTPTVQLALQMAAALGAPLSRFLLQAEAGCGPHRPAQRAAFRRLNSGRFRNETQLRQLTSLTHQGLRGAIEDCCQTLDLIDSELARRNSPPVSQLVEPANLSAMLGNLLAAGLAGHSNGVFSRNAPHADPALLSNGQGQAGVEVKTALETNKPGGHAPRAGVHLTFRYVLGDRAGRFVRGPANRGDTAFIWEVKVGRLQRSDYDVSKTEGEAGGTAVIKTAVLKAMTLVYYDPALLPFAKSKDGRYPGFN